MNIGKLALTLGKLLLAQAKKNPKTAAVIVGTIVGGTVGAKIKKEAEKLPDGLGL